MTLRYPHLLLVSAAALALAGCETIGEPVAEAVAPTFRTNLTGAAEVPGPGDPDGRGMAEVSIVDAADQLCYELDVSGIAPANAAHIHEAAPGAAGPPVITLMPPTDGSSSGCLTAGDELLKRIAANPQNFYVNVHNAEYPAGAVRGQLQR